jgi:serine/threonine-protein kinase
VLSSGPGGLVCARCTAKIAPAARFCGTCGTAVAGRPISVPPDPYIGAVLNKRFRVEAKLGEGGFGAVYRGVQEATGRQVALKLLHPRMTENDQIVERFRREGQVLCKLSDAHTITTYDFDTTPDGTLFIAMELLKGQSLQTVFSREAPVPWQRMFKIVTQICSSLAEAHNLGIVHRDLKPENVYLETRGGEVDFVKVLDFGIAKLIGADSAQQFAQLTATGQTLGTLEYMSPEQLMGRALDGRSDIYALGVVTFELMTGRLPFPDAIGPAALIAAQLRTTPPRPSSLALDIPPAVDAVILKMLEKAPNDRYADVQELRKACQDVLKEFLIDMPDGEGTPPGSIAIDSWAIPVVQAPVGDPEPLEALVVTGHHRAVEPPPQPFPVKPWVLVVVSALVGGIIAFLVAQWLQ